MCEIICVTKKKTALYFETQGIISPLTKFILRNLTSELIGMSLTETTGFNEIERASIYWSLTSFLEKRNFARDNELSIANSWVRKIVFVPIIRDISYLLLFVYLFSSTLNIFNERLKNRQFLNDLWIKTIGSPHTKLLNSSKFHYEVLFLV